MPRISLTDFVDVVAASGSSKGRKVAAIKNRPEYNPAFDFWKPLRDWIVATHRNGKTKGALGSLIPTIRDQKKLTAYPEVIESYRKWWGRKGLTWFQPPYADFSMHGVDVSINPELGLEINGIHHVIKLYFKAEELSKARVDVTLHLLHESLAALCPNSCVIGLLEVRRPKLYQPTVPIPTLTASLGAELAYIADLWENV